MNDTSGNIEMFEMKYRAAVQTIKEAIQRSQARALHVVNSEVLSLNYGIGRYISENSRKSFWGTSALAQISCQLPGQLSFYLSALDRQVRKPPEDLTRVLPPAEELSKCIENTDEPQD